MNFTLGDIIQHVKTGIRYRIAMTPPQGLTIEATGELAYMYQPVNFWRKYYVQCQEEMEDGRFVLVREP